MSLIFWRKTRDTPVSANPESVAVTEDTPLPVRLLANEDDDAPRVQLDQPYLPPVAGVTLERLVQIPGIGTASIYAAGDAFGTLITWHNVFRAEKCSGTIVGAYLIDLDDEGIQVDIPIWIRSFTTTADNSAFAPTDADVLGCRAVISITGFSNWNANQFGQYEGSPRWVRGESPHLYTQAVVQGTPTIAAGAVPWLGILIVPD